MKFFVGFLLGLILIPVGLYFYLLMGMAPVATSSPALPLEKRLTHMALAARIKKEATNTPPIPVNDSNLLLGVAVYEEHCAVCHGVPGKPQTAIAKGMFPKPPQLFHGKGVTDDPPSETYWKAANGIRLTGMPGFKDSLSDAELWQVSLLLANADKLPASVQSALNENPSPKETPPAETATHKNKKK